MFYKKLKIHIEKELVRGVPKWIIRKDLSNAGWADTDIDRVFESSADKKKLKEILLKPFAYIAAIFNPLRLFKKIESLLANIFLFAVKIFKFVLDKLSFLPVSLYKGIDFFTSVFIKILKLFYLPAKKISIISANILIIFWRIVCISVFFGYKIFIYWPLISFYFIFQKGCAVFLHILALFVAAIRRFNKLLFSLFVKKPLKKAEIREEIVAEKPSEIIKEPPTVKTESEVERIKEIEIPGPGKIARLGDFFFDYLKFIGFWLYKIIIFWPVKAFLAVLFEIKEIVKGSFITISKGFLWFLIKLKKLAVKPFKYFLVLPNFIAKSYKLAKEYVIELVERILNFIEKIFISVLRLIFSPFVILGVAFSFLKSKILFAYRKIFGVKEKVIIIRETALIPETLEAELSAAEARHENMTLVDILQLATRMFKTRRLRTFLTILGIGVGIGTILFLVSLGYGLQNLIFEKIATSESLLSLDIVPASEAIKITPQIVDEFSKIENVEKVSPLSTVNGQVSSGDIIASGFIYGVNPDYFSLAGLKPTTGNFFTSESESDKEIVVSSALVKLLTPENNQKVVGWLLDISLFLPERPGSEEIKTARLEEKYKIVGVIDEPVVSFIYFPLKDISNLDLPDYSNIKVKVTKNNFLDSVRDQILAKGFLVSSISDTLEQAQKIFGIAQIVLSLFGIVALIVSAIGMFNTMTIALLERTQEIGIMKAIGASNLDVWKMFLAESIMMGFLGGLGGIMVGILGSALFNYGINLLAGAFGGENLNLFQRPSWFIVTIIVFATVVGFFTGLWPARRAAKLNALDALRYK